MVKLRINDPTHLFADDRKSSAEACIHHRNIKVLRQENPDTPLALIMAIDVFNRFERMA